MERREFARRAMAALTGLGLAGKAGAGEALAGETPDQRLPWAPAGGRTVGTTQDLRVDGARLNGTLDDLTAFGRTPEGGISRVAFSEADRQALDYARTRLEEVGFRVHVDAAANLVARKEGTADLAPLMFGSHLDSVPDGGNFDGQVGSMGALEVARTLHEADHRTRHPLEAVFFTNEEGGKTGSRAMAGEVEPFELDLPTASGLTIGEGLRANGGDPDNLDRVRREPGSVAAFFELHVEQGFVLDRRGLDIGVVEGIVGIRRWNVTVEGFANHAGTTPMADRHDAMVAAARLVDAVNTLALETPGTQVATVGRIQAEPGAPNVIPGRVVMSLEIRDLAMEKIQTVFDAVAARAGDIGEATGTTISFEPFYLSRAAPTDPRLRDAIENAALGMGLQALRMPSGAGHDAQSIALLGPVGMIFVPSVDGISHSPLERSRPDEIEAGTNVLLHAMLAADRDLD